MELNMFFNHHPVIPKNQIGLPFKVDKAFKRENGTNRVWLTYSFSKKALFCSVCLAFESKETNSFNSNCGMVDWKHVYQRIEEHERTILHGRNCDAYFMHLKNKTIDKLLYSQYPHKRNQKVINNRQILSTIINVIKFIGKTGLSYRGNLNEAAYSLENENIDHGNFLEIVLLISKYDIIFKKHLDVIIKASKRAHEKGNTRRTGNFLTFLSKTTINSIISIITKIMKKKMSVEILEAEMFSVEIDSTQDISTKEQCSVLIRYVYMGNIIERLFSLIRCTDTTGKGFEALVLNVLEKERFKISTFNVVMDIVVEAMNNRFLKNMDICRDMAILDPNNFEEICNKKSLPDNCMKYLSAKIIKYNSTATSSQLKEALLSFASNWEKLKLTLEDTYKTNYDLDLHIIEDDYDDEDGIDTVNLPNSSEITDVKLKKNICKSCKNCAICCYTVILKYNMFQGAYCALATAYQYLLTLPITQVECERSFSVLKYIKNRLRNRLTDDRLESFVIMNVEKSILNTVDNEEVINSLAAESSLLKKALIY
ncbi:hypothetical protein Zmor_023532 [Zophobas morio]|uniref:HAT C-terminal dimerisation domain-containing protein n=1 Tax=Zophobas morio TaxID=2755281 RepID=A0AA38HX49_9CUCU|nr:hypothetical protein Zmor_023532 [Zophobas morio]